METDESKPTAEKPAPETMQMKEHDKPRQPDDKRLSFVTVAISEDPLPDSARTDTRGLSQLEYVMRIAPVCDRIMANLFSYSEIIALHNSSESMAKALSACDMPGQRLVIHFSDLTRAQQLADASSKYKRIKLYVTKKLDATQQETVLDIIRSQTNIRSVHFYLLVARSGFPGRPFLKKMVDLIAAHWRSVERVLVKFNTHPEIISRLLNRLQINGPGLESLVIQTKKNLPRLNPEYFRLPDGSDKNRMTNLSINAVSLIDTPKITEWLATCPFENLKFLHFGPTHSEARRSRLETAVRTRWPHPQHDVQVVYTSRIHKGDKGKFFTHYRLPATQMPPPPTKEEPAGDETIKEEEPEWPEMS